jgi:hypothetical protein
MAGIRVCRRTPTTYYGCASYKTGSLKMVQASATCAKGETFISWNNVGPKGDTGLSAHG